ncbi:type II secretion system F family protein [Modestobacter sp. NPDC049651]|uniref:type II secretion system F family protein n=1 Tax=unclassified Modestobacter TaxID=2643866 RepID=UPI0033F21F8A
MTAALLCLAAALGCWPGRRAGRLRAARPVRLPDPGVLAARPLAAVPAALLAGLAGALLSTPVVAGLVAGAAALAVRAAQRRGRDQAAQRRAAALAEALGAVAAEVRAGRTLEEAAERAVAGGAEPGTAALLGPVLRSGAVPPDAGPLAPLLGRVAAAVQVSRRTGCSLAGVLAAMEDDLRAQRQAEQELRSSTAGPRASAAVLAGLPLLGLVMGSGVGADPWRVLTTTLPGTVLLVAGVALELAGTVWTARLVQRAVRR